MNALLERYRVPVGRDVSLDQWRTDDDGGLEKSWARERFQSYAHRLNQLQRVMYAQGRHALLIMLQAMDAGGKDSTIRKVLTPVNPQGCRVVSYKAPSERERGHDFLWRIHRQVPARGEVCVHNRSHYEDVLAARVKKLVPEAIWSRRYDHINHFEQLLVDEGTTVVKLFLHISKDYQRKRLQRRLDRPDKHWKFCVEDLDDRERWDDFQRAYEIAMTRCNSPAAPWYVIPAERRWFRNLLAMAVIVETLEALDMSYPEPDFDPEQVVVR